MADIRGGGLSLFYQKNIKKLSLTDRAAYIAALSSAEDTDARRECLGQLWDACHRSMKEIAADAGLSARKLAERFCVPYRTMENWGGGVNAAPLYLRLMMQECLGLLDISGLE